MLILEVRYGMTATFSDKDQDRIRRMRQYQHRKGLSHFIDAVRQLYNDALQLKEITDFKCSKAMAASFF